VKSPFRLIPDAVSTDTVECLELLLSKARRGEVIGLAYGAMLRKRAYVVNTAGEAHRNPTFSRGMVAALDDQLSRRVHGPDGPSVR
jgi:hypothetical protein